MTRKTEPWNIRLYLTHSKAEMLAVLANLDPAVAASVLNGLHSDNICILCAGEFDLRDNITPHALLTMISARYISTAFACKACVAEHTTGTLLRTMTKEMCGIMKLKMDVASLKSTEEMNQVASEATAELFKRLLKGVSDE